MLVQRNPKLTTYKTIIKRTVIFGYESSTLTEKAEEALGFLIAEHWKNFVSIRENYGWCIKYNYELRDLYKELRIAEYFVLKH